MLTMLAQQSGHQVEQWIQERNRQSQNLASTTLLHEEFQRLLATNPKSDEYFLIQYRLHRQLELMIKAHPWILEADLNHLSTGRILMSSNPSRIGKNFSGTTQQIDQLQNGHTLASPVTLSQTFAHNIHSVLETNMPTRRIFAPIQLTGEPIGILTLHSNVLEIGNKIASFKTSSVSRQLGISTLDVYLVDGQGTFLSPSSFEEHLRETGEIIRRSELELKAMVPGGQTMTTAFQACQKLHTGSLSERTFQMDSYADYRGIPVIGAWRPVAGSNWCVIAEIDEEEFRSPLQNLQQITFAIVAGMGIIFGVLGQIASNYLIKPLLHVTNVAHHISNGNRSIRVQSHRTDEIGQLGATLNHMADSIDHNLEVLEEKVQELEITRDHALEAARAKSDFLSTMSHEIRTPMNGVIGMADLLKDTDLTAEQQDCVQTIQKSGIALLAIINDILDFSKIEAGKLDLETVDFNLRTTVEDVLDLLAETAGRKNLELVGLIDTEIPSLLVGDPGRVRQILTNIIGNALKFTHQGEVAIHVQRLHDTTKFTSVRFDVTDTGIGLTADVQSQLFQSFKQADSSTTRKYGGTGLGLAICKNLVEVMGGQIGVQSQVGQGSCFWFTLSFGKSSTSAHDLIAHTNFENLHICLVDDNATNLSTLQYYTQRWGMRYEPAWNGDQALALLNEATERGDPFDLAILDCHMPEMDGVELAKQIKATPHLTSLPLILLTSGDSRGESAQAKAAKFAAYLRKPIRLQKLFDSLNIVLRLTSTESPLPKPTSPTLVTKQNLEEIQLRGKLRILLAEDNIINQKVAVKMLSKLGYRTDVVGNGHEVLTALAKRSYDLILMDCQMPEMDGYEATGKIRKTERAGLEGRSQEQESERSKTSYVALHPSYSTIPIIALTANASKEDREKCFAIGMDDFLSKPVKLLDLEQKLDQWLPQERTEHQSSHQTIPSESGTTSSTSRPTTEKNTMPSLNLNTLDELRALGGEDEPEFLTTVITQFLEDLLQHTTNIHAALDEADPTALQKSSHALKGSAKAIGAEKLVALAFRLETIGRDRTLEKAQEAFILLKQEVSLIEAESHSKFSSISSQKI